MHVLLSFYGCSWFMLSVIIQRKHESQVFFSVFHIFRFYIIVYFSYRCFLFTTSESYWGEIRHVLVKLCWNCIPLLVQFAFATASRHSCFIRIVNPSCRKNSHDLYISLTDSLSYINKICIKKITCRQQMKDMNVILSFIFNIFIWFSAYETLFALASFLTTECWWHYSHNVHVHLYVYLKNLSTFSISAFRN